jgi:hypothetical protein
MEQLRLVLVLCCVVLACGLVACNQGLSQPLLSPLLPSPISSLTVFNSPVSAPDSLGARPTTLPGVRPSDTPDAVTTPLIIAGAAVGAGGDEVVQIRNISAEKMDLSSYSLYNPDTRQRFDFPSGFELASGEKVEIHSGISKEAAQGGLFWTENPVWSGGSEDILLLSPAGRLVFWYVFKKR